MFYRLAADCVLVFHLAFIVFVLLGGLSALRWPRMAWLHLTAVAWGAAIEFIGFQCPLTFAENALRERGGEAGYSGGFIEHYVTALIYPQGLTREIQIVLGMVVLAVNALVYSRILRKPRVTTQNRP